MLLKTRTAPKKSIMAASVTHCTNNSKLKFFSLKKVTFKQIPRLMFEHQRPVVWIIEFSNKRKVCGPKGKVCYRSQGALYERRMYKEEDLVHLLFSFLMN